MEIYSEFASRTDWQPGVKLQLWLSKRFLKTYLKNTNKNALDIDMIEVGCGNGNLALAAAEIGFKSYIGVEPNSTLVEIATSRILLGSIVQSKLPDLDPSLFCTADLGVVIHVIEHAPDGYEAREWIRGLAAVVRPGGNLLIVSPDVRDFRESFWSIDWSHCFPTTVTNLSQILVDLGFEIIVAKKFRFGSVNRFANLVAWLSSFVIPSRFLDLIFRKQFKRELGTGLKVALFWGVAFVVAQKPLETQ